ncbi:START domain-containing protein [Pseudomonas typographi]|uniref:START domain-containing protein n=1 Tax=Pseudomonas typographi TaxID=2715964 RepID=A0ABR7Z1Y5_9PSED|nr:START domain-containing protein [Pseudomonas typographi]MBD1599506.1 START domain-containing protein [Pseudomonas typographi]
MRSTPSIALLFTLALTPLAAAHAEDWQVAKSEQGITVSLADVPGSSYKAYRGTTLINASLDKIRALQEDLPNACRWIHECKVSKLLKSHGAEAWTYTQFNTPWPVTPRDSVVHVVSREAADGSLTRTLEGVPGYIPEEKGFVRVTEVKGFWALVPKGPNSTEVTYQVHTEPGGSVPSWVANKFVVDAPFNTLKGLKAAAEK